MVISDIPPALKTHRISNGIPSATKKSACVEDATGKCRISVMQRVGFWAQFMLCLKDYFPFPFNDQVLDTLSGKQYFSFLDGYSK